MALYGREIELLETYGPAAFGGYGNCNKNFVMEYIRKEQAKRCNSYVGKQYSIIQAVGNNVFFKADLNSVCIPGEVCNVAGKRGRTEWCNDCNKIV